MEIRKITEKDLVQSAECAVQAFGGTIEPADLKMPEYDVIATFEGDILTSRIEIYDKQVYFGHGQLHTLGIGGVATKAEYRRSGSVRKLFNHIFDNYDCDISILYAFSSGYYRKFGYETVAPAMSLETPITNLTAKYYPDVHLLREENESELIELYNRLAEKRNLCFARNNANNFSLKPFETQDFTYAVKNENGEFSGYIAYNFNREESLIAVNEIIFDTMTDLEHLLGFLRFFDANIKNIRFEKIPVDSPIIYFCDREEWAKRELKSMGSVRIHNVANVLKMKKYPDSAGNFTIKINDEIERNNGIFRVEYSNGTGKITKTDGEFDIELNAPAMSKILLGGISYHDAHHLPGVNIINENDDFYRAFLPADTQFYDGF